MDVGLQKRSYGN